MKLIIHIFIIMALHGVAGMGLMTSGHAGELRRDLGANLALNKPYVSSDPNKSNWGTGLTDGSWTDKKGNVFATGFLAKFPKTVTIDLQRVEEIAYVHTGVPGFGSTKRVAVSISRDGDAFVDVGAHDFTFGKKESHVFEFKPAMARYVRLSFLENHGGQMRFPVEYCFASEVEVFGKAGGGPTQTDNRATALPSIKEVPRVDLPDGLGPNLALAKPYASSDESITYWNTGLTDGLWGMNRGMTFATNKTEFFPKFVTIDLRCSAKLTHVLLGVPDFGATKGVTVSVSYDGIKFIDVGSHDFPPGRATSHLFSFNPVLARIVRLTYSGNHDESIGDYPRACCFTTEVEVYAKPGE